MGTVTYVFVMEFDRHWQFEEEDGDRVDVEHNIFVGFMKAKAKAKAGMRFFAWVYRRGG